MALCVRWALCASLCLGCHKPASPEALGKHEEPLSPERPLPEAIPAAPAPRNLDEVDLLSLIPELEPGVSGCYRVPEDQWPALAWRVHREVMALEDAIPLERATLDDLVLRFHLHMLAFDLSDTEYVQGPPFYGGLDGRPFNTHQMRAAQLLRLVPALAQAPLAPHYVALLEPALALIDQGGAFANEALVLERLRPPYVWKDNREAP